MGLGGFRLLDGSGHEMVVLIDETPAVTGTPVTVTGQFLIAFAAGNLTIPLIIAQKH